MTCISWTPPQHDMYVSGYSTILGWAHQSSFGSKKVVTDQNRTYLCEPVGPLRGRTLAYAHVNGADYGLTICGAVRGHLCQTSGLVITAIFLGKSGV